MAAPSAVMLKCPDVATLTSARPRAFLPQVTVIAIPCHVIWEDERKNRLRLRRPRARHPDLRRSSPRDRGRSSFHDFGRHGAGEIGVFVRVGRARAAVE